LAGWEYNSLVGKRCCHGARLECAAGAAQAGFRAQARAKNRKGMAISMLFGKRLMEDVRNASAGPGGLCFWWLGQMGFIIKTRTAVFAIDLYVSPGASRLVPPLLKPDELRGVDYVLGTHDHSDHIDGGAWPGFAAASPAAKFVVPAMFRGALPERLRIPGERFVALDEGIPYRDEARGVAISAIASAHEFLDRDPASGFHPSLGYLIETDGLRIYHAGDSLKYDGLEKKLSDAGPIDLFFAPINGRDGAKYHAGIIGNMGFCEAVDLAGAVKPRLAVPGHYDMFAANSENPIKFVSFMEAKFPDQAFWIGGHGVKATLPAR
jgi:L-ascorbate metabolism protein UlaG (beta-lactamase superfamily)